MKYQYGKYPINCRLEKHWKYLKYVIKHKYYVFIECCKLGIPLRGLLHDISKFRPSEWFSYAEMFYGKYGCGFNGGYAWEHKRNLQVYDEFNRAWLLHQHRNPHHWQYWILVQDDNSSINIMIPKKFYLEMLADWWGASISINGIDSMKNWYDKHRYTIQLNDFTRIRIEKLIGIKKGE